MEFKNLIIVAEGSLFNEKAATRAALKNTLKAFQPDQSFDGTLFTELYRRYEDSSRSERNKILLTAFLAKIDFEKSYPIFLNELAKQGRLVKDGSEFWTKIQAYNLALFTYYPQDILSQRLEKANLKPQPLIFNDDFTAIIHKLHWDKNETLLIGNNLSDEIATANQAGIPSLWINTNRKIPITPHPDLHVKKLADSLFYLKQ